MKTQLKKYTAQGMKRDIAPGAHPENFLYEANNIRYLTNVTVISNIVYKMFYLQDILSNL